MGQLQRVERRLPVAETLRIEGCAGRRGKQPDPRLSGAARQLAEQGEGAAVRRAAWVAGHQQARGRRAGQAFEQAVAAVAVVEIPASSTPDASRGGQGWRSSSSTATSRARALPAGCAAGRPAA